MIYLDSCIVIYAVEGSDDRARRVRERLTRAEHPLAFGPMVALECLVGALRRPDMSLRDRYLERFAGLIPLESGMDAHLRAAEIRATHRVATPDALHLATAQLSGCAELWTNDRRLVPAAAGVEIVAVG